MRNRTTGKDKNYSDLNDINVHWRRVIRLPFLSTKMNSSTNRGNSFPYSRSSITVLRALTKFFGVRNQIRDETYDRRGEIIQSRSYCLFPLFIHFSRNRNIRESSQIRERRKYENIFQLIKIVSFVRIKGSQILFDWVRYLHVIDRVASTSFQWRPTFLPSSSLL